jgi:hypothetical protein
MFVVKGSSLPLEWKTWMVLHSGRLRNNSKTLD